MSRREPRPPGTPSAHAKTAKCGKCLEEKDITLFVRDRTRVSGRFPWCKQCVIAVRKEYREREGVADYGTGENRQCVVCLKGLDGAHANRQYCSALCKGRSRRWALFGLTPENMRALTATGECPICGKKVRQWHVDHNHLTGETTGPVCAMCNQHLLAYTNHDPAIAAKLLAYLTESPVQKLIGTRRYSGPEGVSQIHRKWLWSGIQPNPEDLSKVEAQRRGLI